MNSLYQGATTRGGPVKLKSGKGKSGSGRSQIKVTVQEMIAHIQAKFPITDEEAILTKQVNGVIQATYNDMGRYEEPGPCGAH